MTLRSQHEDKGQDAKVDKKTKIERTQVSRRVYSSNSLRSPTSGLSITWGKLTSISQTAVITFLSLAAKWIVY